MSDTSLSFAPLLPPLVQPSMGRAETTGPRGGRTWRRQTPALASPFLGQHARGCGAMRAKAVFTHTHPMGEGWLKTQLADGSEATSQGLLSKVIGSELQQLAAQMKSGFDFCP